jgi:hypothetical protein
MVNSTSASGSLGALKLAHAGSRLQLRAAESAARATLFKRLAMSAWNDALPSEKERQAGNLARFMELERRLAGELADFSDEDFRNPGAAFDQRVAALAVFMYLFDKTMELHEAVLRKNKVGLYSLFDSARNSVFRLLSGGYFSRPPAEAMRDYLRDEPLLIACADLAGVELVPVQDAVVLYQPVLKERVLALIRADEKRGGEDAGGENSAQKTQPRAGNRLPPKNRHKA